LIFVKTNFSNLKCQDSFLSIFYIPALEFLLSGLNDTDNFKYKFKDSLFKK